MESCSEILCIRNVERDLQIYTIQPSTDPSGTEMCRYILLLGIRPRHGGVFRKVESVQNRHQCANL